MKKKNFVLRINEAMYDALEKWAADEFRSVNGQIEWVIARALKEHKRLKQETQEPPSERGDATG
ncbi:MAG: Arc family DNA binding domain-containing protein [Saprospiraceae bacterium]|jgi:hypothetical protein